MENLRFDSRALHGPDRQKNVHNCTRYPVYAGVAFNFESAEDMEVPSCIASLPMPILESPIPVLNYLNRP